MIFWAMQSPDVKPGSREDSNGEGYHEAVQSGHIPLSEEEVDTICDLVKQDNMPERTVIATLRYDNQICGFIYMERNAGK